MFGKMRYAPCAPTTGYLQRHDVLNIAQRAHGTEPQASMKQRLGDGCSKMLELKIFLVRAGLKCV